MPYLRLLIRLQQRHDPRLPNLLALERLIDCKAGDEQIPLHYS
jgi:hypothetical protein